MTIDKYFIDDYLPKSILSLVQGKYTNKPAEEYDNDLLCIIVSDMKKLDILNGKDDTYEGMSSGLFAVKNLYETMGDRAYVYHNALLYLLNRSFMPKNTLKKLSITLPLNFGTKNKKEIEQMKHQLIGDKTEAFYKSLMVGAASARHILDADKFAVNDLTEALAFASFYIWTERMRTGLYADMNRRMGKLIATFEKGKKYELSTEQQLLSMSESELSDYFVDAVASFSGMQTQFSIKPDHTNQNGQVIGIYTAKYPKQAKEIFERHGKKFRLRDGGLEGLQEPIIYYRKKLAKQIFGKFLKGDQALNAYLQLGKIISNLNVGLGKMQDMVATTESKNLQELVSCCLVESSYLIQKYIGDGTQGMLFKVHSPAIDKPRALKLYYEGRYNEEEARNMGILEVNPHPNLPKIMDAGDHIATFDGKPVNAIVMEYIEGKKIIPGKVSPTDVQYYGIQLLRALYHLHTLGISHRDLNPDNIIITNDPKTNLPLLKLVDFGISTTDAKAGEKDNRKMGGTDLQAFGQYLFFLQTGKYMFAPTAPTSNLAEDIKRNRDRVIGNIDEIIKLERRVHQTISRTRTSEAILIPFYDRDIEYAYECIFQGLEEELDADYPGFNISSLSV